MSLVDEYAARCAAALDGVHDPVAENFIGRVLDTLNRAVRPLSGRDVRRATHGGDVEVTAALRALVQAGQVAAFPRREPGGGTYYMPAARYRQEAT